MNLKAKDFAKKEALQKSLSTLLKKPLMALLSGKVEKLPFCYEAEYFDDGSGFMSIGVAKEVDKMFKTKRSKGQGTEGKINKKKVAYGVCKLAEDGSVEFCVIGGMMKPMEAKKCIKSIPILKKKIGDKYIISKGEISVDDNESEEASNEEDPNQKASAESGASKDDASDILKTLGKDIFTTFPSIQKQFDREKADQISESLKEWIKTYKDCENEVKKSFKDMGGKMQKVAGYLKKAIQVDVAIDKIVEPLFKDIDSYNDMVDHSTEQGKKLKATIEAEFNKAVKFATSIKDTELIQVLNDYMSELKD